MNNLECTITVLRQHREARAWTDDVVAGDLLAQLDVDPLGDAAKARFVKRITVAEVLAQEAAAKAAVEAAKAARAELDAQEGVLQGDVAVEPLPLPVGGIPAHEVETVHYRDGTSATGGPDLPKLSPEEQRNAIRLGLPPDATYEEIDAAEAKLKAAEMSPGEERAAATMSDVAHEPEQPHAA